MYNAKFIASVCIYFIKSKLFFILKFLTFLFILFKASHQVIECLSIYNNNVYASHLETTCRISKYFHSFN